MSREGADRARRQPSPDLDPGLQDCTVDVPGIRSYTERKAVEGSLFQPTIISILNVMIY